MNENLTPTPGRDVPGRSHSLRGASGRPARRIGAAALGLTLALTGVACSSSKKTSTDTGSSGSTTPARPAAGERHAERRRLVVPGSRSSRRASPGFTAPAAQGHHELPGHRLGRGQEGPRRPDRVDFAGTDSPGQGRRGSRASKGGAFLYFPIVGRADHRLLQPLGRRRAAAQPRHAGQDLPARKITTWNDPAIEADNPGATLPSTRSWSCTARTARARRATSPSTSTRRLPRPGRSAAVTRSTGRPTPRPASGNTGVAQIIRQTDGAIGYVDFSDAKASEARRSPRSRTRPASSSTPTLDGAQPRPWRRDGQARPDLQPAQRRRAPRPTRSRRRPGSSSTRSRPTRPRATRSRATSTTSSTDGQALADDVDFAPLPDAPRSRRRSPRSTRSQHRLSAPRDGTIDAASRTATRERRRGSSSDPHGRARAVRVGPTGVVPAGSRLARRARSSWSSWRLIAVSTTKRRGRRSREGLELLHLERLGPAARTSSAPWPSSTARCSSRSSRSSRRAGQHRHRPVHHRGRAAAAARAGHLRDRPARRGPVGRLRPVGLPRARARRSQHVYHDIADAFATASRCSDASSAAPASGTSFMTAGHHPGDHDHADHHLAHPRGVRHRARRTTRRRRSALGATRWEMIRGAVLPAQSAAASSAR